MSTGARKETPRQKMIGMMYLFYTALLALQVSNSVLERFIFINKSLEKQIQENNIRNGEVVLKISNAIEERGNRADDQKILDRAKEIREETHRVIKYCSELKNEMVVITGGTDENGQMVGGKDQDKVANLMINQKKGIELKDALNNYSKFLEEKAGMAFPDIAMDGKDNPVFQHDRDQRVKNFSTLTFENTPTAAGMASVSQLMTEVMNQESAALEKLAQEVGAGEVKFDKVFVMAQPESKFVAAGTSYKADLFLAASSSAVAPEMFLNGTPLPVEEGFGKIEFKATASGFDKEGQAKRTYMASINYNDSTFEREIEYIVVKPTLQITSDAVKALYLNCGNPLNVQCPQLGTLFSPTFSATGATVIPQPSDRTSITVVPSGAKTVTLNVNSGGVFIGSENFPVRRVPSPTIELLNESNQLIDEARGLQELPRQITLKINPDADFANALPKEARYRPSRWRVTLATGADMKAREEITNSVTFNLNTWRTRARKGDRVVIEIFEVERANFRDEVEKVAMAKVTKQFTLIQ
ncbi:MAG: gliding motility protein GldM [Cyclobacteriaceae bacterium]|nr:gliding motility protein GldM [Cyclobacteriaceae bacterium]